MPLEKPEHFGTNKDGSPSEEYCIYCFKDGEFTSDLTMDQMIEQNLQYLSEFNKDSEVQYTPEQARAAMKEFFPHLKRWRK